MIRAFFRSKEWFWWAYGGGFLLVSLKCVEAYLMVKVNNWYGYIFDLLQEASKNPVDDFDRVVKLLIYILAAWALTNSAVNTFNRFWALAWRKAITLDFMQRSRNKEIEGSSQRIQDDPRRFAEIIEYLAPQIINACIVVIAFTPVLWILSSGVEIKYLKNLPGSLVLIALLFNGGGVIISWFVGAKLPELDYNIREIEATLRKELVYEEDDKTESVSIEILTKLVRDIKQNSYRLFLHLFYFDIWRNLFSKTIMILPFIIIGPSLFNGTVTLGVFARVSDALLNIYQSVSPFIDNWEDLIAKLRSTRWHLQEFEAELRKREKNNLTISP